MTSESIIAIPSKVATPSIVIPDSNCSRTQISIRRAGTGVIIALKKHSSRGKLSKRENIDKKNIWVKICSG
jgi:hypothetical protein